MRWIASILAVLFILVLVSCTIPKQVELYNNAKMPIELTINSDIIRIEPSKKALLGAQIEIAELSVRSGPEEYRYDLKLSIPEEYVAWSGWGFWRTRTIRLQFELDGKVWLIGEDEKPPTTTFISQPKGFPLEPIAR